MHDMFYFIFIAVSSTRKEMASFLCIDVVCAGEEAPLCVQNAQPPPPQMVALASIFPW